MPVEHPLFGRVEGCSNIPGSVDTLYEELTHLILLCADGVEGVPGCVCALGWRAVLVVVLPPDDTSSISCILQEQHVRAAHQGVVSNLQDKGVLGEERDVLQVGGG